MTDNITLPRAAEQAREALELALRWLYACDDSEPDEPECDHGLHYHDCQHNPCPKRDCRAALAALDAALAGGSEMSAIVAACRQVAPEPDAKREPVHPGYVIGSHWLETAHSRIAAGEAEAEVLAEVLGARGWAKREPATNKEIDAEWLKIKPVLYPMYGLGDFRDGFRAAERFHGITKEGGK